jgi:DNA-binding response OmpR family regulator
MTVLLIEPSATFARFLKLVLARLGYQVIHRANADNIQETILSTAPDLIITEAILANQSGLDTCRLVQNDDHFSTIPVIIISTDGSMETKQEAQNAGCVDYMAKPVTSRDLHELMQRHLPFHHKRNSIRAKMVLNATVSDGRKSMEMKIISMGEGGLCIETNEIYLVGTRLDLVLPLPSLRSPVKLRGEVVYLQKTPEGPLLAGMGVKFIGMDHNTTTLLQHYMESYLSDFLPETPQNG